MTPLPTREQAEDEISAELVRVHEESYGAGVTNVESHEAERTMLEAGKVDAVRGIREDFQEVIGVVFIAIVERATGRRVSSWVSRMSVDPVYRNSSLSARTLVQRGGERRR